MAQQTVSNMSVSNGEPSEPSLYRDWLALVAPMLRQNLPLGGDVTQWIRAWGEAVGQVGLLNINYAGSSDPQAERRISGRYSYGRQLGRMMEIMGPLVKRHEAQFRNEVGDKAVQDFLEMVDEITILKQASVDEIVSRVSDWRKSPDFKQKLDHLLLQLTALRNAT